MLCLANGLQVVRSTLLNGLYLFVDQVLLHLHVRLHGPHHDERDRLRLRSNVGKHAADLPHRIHLVS